MPIILVNLNNRLRLPTQFPTILLHHNHVIQKFDGMYMLDLLLKYLKFLSTYKEL